MSSSFEEIEEMLIVAIMRFAHDYRSLAMLTHRLYLIEQKTGMNKLLLEQVLLEKMIDMGIGLS